MDRKTYEKTTEREFKGRKVVSLVPLINGWARFPAGMTWTIEGKQGGFALVTDPCPHCGIRCSINKVSPGQVDFTDQRSIWPKA